MTEFAKAVNIYLKTRPSTSTEYDDFMAGWEAAVEAAARQVEEFVDERTHYRAGACIRENLS